MARPRKSDRPIALRLYLPESLVAELKIRLWSEAEDKIPHGVISAFAEAAIRHYLNRPPGQQEPANGNLP